MRKSKFILSVILPTFNEAGNIIRLIDNISNYSQKAKTEIIVIDDNSTDETGQLVRQKYKADNNVRVIIRKEKGLASAIFAGLKITRGERVLVMDTDFNHNPKVIPEMLSKLNDFDLVVGSRYVKGGGMENKLRNSLSKSYNFLILKLLKIPVHDALSGFFMIRTDKLQDLLSPAIFSGYGDYFLRFLFYAYKCGLRIAEIPVYYRNRDYGESKSQFLRMFTDYTRVVIELLFSKNPDKGRAA